jgi:hypothetical protein
MKLSPQTAIADVLFEHDDLTIAEIVDRCAMPVTVRQAAQILFDAVRRKHVVRNVQITRTAVNRQVHLYSLTLLGRSAAPLICSPEALLRAPRRTPRIAPLRPRDMPRNAEPTVTLPLRAVRALLAVINAQEQSSDVREAFDTALRATRPEIVHAQ